jgi:AcrR family transcriptional regulator
MAKSSKSKRLTRDHWLSQAIDFIGRSGRAPSIEAIAKELKVSKGSFYHHFADRDDFVQTVVSYWDNYSTREPAEKILQTRKSAKNKLWDLMVAIDDNNYAELDLAMRSLAMRYPNLRQQLERTDKYRFSVIRQLFEEIGFSGEDLDARTRLFVTSTSLEKAIFGELSPSAQRKYLKQKHKLFTSR